MKKILASLLMACLVLSMVACGSNADDAPAGGENDVVVDTQVETEPATEPATEPETEVADVPEVEDTEVVEEVAYTYTDLSQTMYAKRDVNVRALPSVDGNKVDGLSFAEEVTVTGKCNETGWYRISYGGNTAYVSNNYLVSEKPEPQPVTTAPAEAPAEPEVVLEKSPWTIWGEPYYDAASDSVYYFYVEGHDMHHYHFYLYACEVLTANNGRTGEYYTKAESMGTYAEGEVFMNQVRVK